MKSIFSRKDFVRKFVIEGDDHVPAIRMSYTPMSALEAEKFRHHISLFDSMDNRFAACRKKAEFIVAFLSGLEVQDGEDGDWSPAETVDAEGAECSFDTGNRDHILQLDPSVIFLIGLAIVNSQGEVEKSRGNS